jgi:pilus assembly protein CpaE
MAASDKIPESGGAEPLSIAVISPDDVRRNLAIKSLDGFPNGRIREFISYPPDIDSVTRMLKKSFDVVIIDLDSDPEYTLALVENICADGATNVIVYSERVDPGLMVRCLRAGAREYLHTPITPSAMTEALVRVWSRRLEASPEAVQEPEVRQLTDGKLLVFLSAKGGSGVTTLATSFALSLAEQSRKRTLLIDLNLPLGDAALNLGTKHLYSSVNAFENASRLDPHFLSSLLVQHKSGLWVLAGPSEMTPYHPADDAIGTLLKVALEDYEYVVVDAGSKLDLQRSIRLDPSVTMYLITQLGIPELRNANRLIKQLPMDGGPSLEIVLNRSDSGSQGIEEDHVAQALTRTIRWRVPNDYAAVRRMQNSAIPLTQEDSPIAQAIRQMTQSICGAPAVEEAPEKKKGRSFFSFSF